MQQNAPSIDAISNHAPPSDEIMPTYVSFSALTRVPPEIFNCIFQLLSKDRQTLSACASLSRYYRELSIPWLFAHITARSAERLTRFIQFIDTHSDLGAYVKQLDFYGYNGILEPFLAHTEGTICAIVSSAVSRLPSLQSLSLCCISLDDKAVFPSTLPPAEIKSEPPITRHLPKLRVTSGGIASWRSVLMWLLSKYTVDILHLSSVEIPPIDDLKGTPALDRLRSTLHIQRLVVDVRSSPRSDPYSLLEAFLQPSCLRTASMLCIASSCAPRILRFMRVTGDNITCIGFDIAYLSVQNDQDQGQCWEILGETLTCCPRLEDLRIRMSAFSMKDYSGLPRHAVFTTIVPCAPRTLRTLTVALVEEPPWNSEFGNIDIWDLEVLSEYHTGAKPTKFPSLHGIAIQLRLRKFNENEELAEILLQKLSALKDAGLLHVFCDNMTQSVQTAFGIKPLLTWDWR